jgi:histidinol-phosphate aminotransferase
VFPSDANFLLIRVPQAPAVWPALKARGVLVKDVGRMAPSAARELPARHGRDACRERALLDALEAARAACEATRGLSGRPEQ